MAPPDKKGVKLSCPTEVFQGLLASPSWPVCKPICRFRRAEPCVLCGILHVASLRVLLPRCALVRLHFICTVGVDAGVEAERQSRAAHARLDAVVGIPAQK